MSRWPETVLAEIASIQMGQSPPGATYNTLGNGLPFFQGKAEFGEDFPTRVKWCNRPNRIAEKDDILLSVRAPVGPTNVAVEKCCIGRGLASIRTNPKVCNQRYLRYYFRRFEEDIAARGVGSTFFAINRTDIERLKLPLPLLPEQERIVNLLDHADELRKLRDQADKRSARLIPALFEDMFGDVEANTKGWEVKNLGDICEINPRSASNSFSLDSKVSFVPMSAVSQVNGSIINKECRNLSDVKKGFTSFKKDDILFAKITPCMENGKAAIARDLINGIGYGSTEFHVLRPKDGFIPEWVFSLIHRPVFRKNAAANFTGTAGQQRVPVYFLHQYRVPMPPLFLQKEFASRVSEIRALESSQSSSRKNLDALFQSMLHRAFQGEL